MNNFESILPEACYTAQNLSFREVEKAHRANQTVVGYVQAISQANKELQVKLGDNVIAYLPFEDTTIYPLSYSTNNPGFPFPLQIACLKEKTICAKVKRIDGKRITLSRKDNMLEVYEHIKNEKKLPFNVTSARTKIVFGDVGQGIQAKISIAELCKPRIRSTSEICQKGDSFFVNVIDFDSMKRANVSYKDTFPPYDPKNYTPGKFIIGKINEPIDDKFSGFFVYVSPQVSGILDYKSWHPILHYGDTVECIVTNASEKGLHLILSKVLKRST